MLPFNCHSENEMKIEHVTYNETHTRRSISRRASNTSMKIKKYISRRLSRHHSEAETTAQSHAERLVTYWPRPGTQSSLPDKPSEMTDYLTKKHHVEKAARKDEKLIVSANNSGSYLPLKDVYQKTVADPASYPKLRRKPKFTDAVKEKLNIKSTDLYHQKAAEKTTMEKLHKVRQAMKEGKLEQVVPPRQLSRTESRPTPPTNGFFDASPVSGDSPRRRSSSRHRTASHTRHSSRSRKTKSSSSRIADYIRTSADILDEKRRDVQSDSAEEQNSNTQAIHALKARQQEYRASRDRRLSGDGITPWAHHVPDNCKLCGKFAMTGLQGLCEECEKDFYRPKAPKSYGAPELEDDIRDTIKPTPPLKDRKSLSMTRERDLQQFQATTNGLEIDPERPPVPLKDMSTRPIFNPIPSRLRSQKERFEFEDDEEDESFLKWKTDSQRDLFEKTHRVAEQWNMSFESDDQVEDKTPLIQGKENGKGKKKDVTRDTNFYRFYDDVLEDR